MSDGRILTQKMTIYESNRWLPTACFSWKHSISNLRYFMFLSPLHCITPLVYVYRGGTDGTNLANGCHKLNLPSLEDFQSLFRTRTMELDVMFVFREFLRHGDDVWDPEVAISGAVPG